MTPWLVVFPYGAVPDHQSAALAWLAERRTLRPDLDPASPISPFVTTQELLERTIRTQLRTRAPHPDAVRQMREAVVLFSGLVFPFDADEGPPRLTDFQMSLYVAGRDHGIRAYAWPRWEATLLPIEAVVADRSFLDPTPFVART